MYTKTPWNEGAAPGISAARLNNLETQFDEAVDEGLVIESWFPVNGQEPAQVELAEGPAAEFSDAVTQAVRGSIVWPWAGLGAKLVLVYKADSANAGGFRLQVTYWVNGLPVAGTAVLATITPGADTNVHTVEVSPLIPAADVAVAAGALVSMTIARLGADATDTHTGKLQLLIARLRKVAA